MVLAAEEIAHDHHDTYGRIEYHLQSLMQCERVVVWKEENKKVRIELSIVSLDFQLLSLLLMDLTMTIDMCRFHHCIMIDLTTFLLCNT